MMKTSIAPWMIAYVLHCHKASGETVSRQEAILFIKSSLYWPAKCFETTDALTFRDGYNTAIDELRELCP